KEILSAGEPTPATAPCLSAQESALEAALESSVIGMLMDRSNINNRSDWWQSHVYEGEEEAKTQLYLYRCIFGNPYSDVTLQPSWLTPSVLKLAESIYKERTFVRMPELGTSLKETGCDCLEMLNHCRGLGPHDRGCWVVDMILRKK